MMPAEFVIHAAVSIDDLRRNLKRQFPIEEDPPVTVQRQYQDSFDWRLHNKHCRLYCETGGRQVMLNLSCHRNGDVNGQVLLQPQQPVFANDVQSPGFRRTLKSLIGIRALISWLTLRVKRYSLRYVDKDGKTRLYIFIEDYHLLQSAGKSRALGRRIHLQPVKGYSRPQRLVAKYLSGDLQLAIAEQSILEQACKVAGIQLGAYSSRLDVQLQPQLRTDQALKKILLYSLQVMEANEAGIIADTDSEFLHDFRVALRRSRAVLSQINQLFPQRVLQRFSRGLKWLGACTGPTRDMHVYLLKFDAYRTSLPAAMRPHLEPLHKFLENHLQQEHRALVKILQSARYRTLKAAWRTFLQAPVPQRSSLSNAAVPVKQTADTHIWKAFRKVIRQGESISGQCPDEKLHKLRITCKKLRYLLEYFEQLYPARKLNPLIKPLKRLQKVLGDFQDLSVQIDSLNRMQQQMREENLLGEQTHQAMDLLAARFHRQKQGLRNKFVDQFAVFSDDRNMDHYRSLFRPARDKS